MIYHQVIARYSQSRYRGSVITRNLPIVWCPKCCERQSSASECSHGIGPCLVPANLSSPLMIFCYDLALPFCIPFHCAFSHETFQRQRFFTSLSFIRSYSSSPTTHLLAILNLAPRPRFSERLSPHISSTPLKTVSIRKHNITFRVAEGS